MTPELLEELHNIMMGADVAVLAANRRCKELVYTAASIRALTAARTFAGHASDTYQAARKSFAAEREASLLAGLADS
jgi:uncharacterized membrane protein YebE (DUF533 family)